MHLWPRAQTMQLARGCCIRFATATFPMPYWASAAFMAVTLELLARETSSSEVWACCDWSSARTDKCDSKRSR